MFSPAALSYTWCIVVDSPPSESRRLWERGLHLARSIGEILAERGLTLAVAESATGGLICHLITEVPGSSRYFLGGVVAYHNWVKERMLRVPKKTLDRLGAVSQETVAAMAEGVRRLLGASVGIASSGIAGPTGATPTKPVGLVYVAVAPPEGEASTKKCQFTGSRSQNKISFACAALQLLNDLLARMKTGF